MDLITYSSIKISKGNYILTYLQWMWLSLTILSIFSLGENFALLRPASQSSTHSSYAASKAVDGNHVADSSCAITNAGDYNPWWKVQLIYPIWVTHVELTNRGPAGGVSSHFVHLCNFDKSTHWGQMAAIFQTTFSNAFSWIKTHEFVLRFH